MKDLDKIKLAFIGFFTAIHTALGPIAIPFYILVGTNVLDYATGIVAAVCRGEKVCSRRGFQGIAKKVCMWLLVLVGAVVDFIIYQAGHSFNYNMQFNFFISLAVVFWLMANELISILENIHDIGVPLPPFLMKIVGYIKEKTEETVDSGIPDKEDNKEE